MNKHTPGPWNATKFNPVTGDIDDCYLYVEPGIAVIERNVRGRDQHDTANSRLIAAAPDLLDALEELKRELILSDVDMDYIESHFRKALNKAHAAIARAKGDA